MGRDYIQAINLQRLWLVRSFSRLMGLPCHGRLNYPRHLCRKYGPCLAKREIRWGFHSNRYVRVNCKFIRPWLTGASNRSLGHDVSYSLQGTVRIFAPCIPKAWGLDSNRVQHLPKLDYCSFIDGEANPPRQVMYTDMIRLALAWAFLPD